MYVISTEKISIGSSIITVDSTVGFNTSGKILSGINTVSYDDKTIKRLIFFAKKFGYGGFYVGNIFPNINTKVNDLYLDLSHDKKKNRKHVGSMIDKSKSVVYAWGKTIDNPPNWIDKIVDKPLCFGFNKNGTPKHPLYLRKSTSLISFR